MYIFIYIYQWNSHIYLKWFQWVICSADHGWGLFSILWINKKRLWGCYVWLCLIAKDNFRVHFNYANIGFMNNPRQLTRAIGISMLYVHWSQAPRPHFVCSSVRCIIEYIPFEFSDVFPLTLGWYFPVQVIAHFVFIWNSNQTLYRLQIGYLACIVCVTHIICMFMDLHCSI